MRPIQSNKQIGKPDAKIIFSIIPTLLSTHSVLLEAVREQLLSSEGRNLGKTFLENVDHLHLYGQFGYETKHYPTGTPLNRGLLWGATQPTLPFPNRVGAVPLPSSVPPHARALSLSFSLPLSSVVGK